MGSLNVILLMAAVLAALVFGGLALFMRRRLRDEEKRNDQYRLDREAENAFLHRIGTCINTSLDLEMALQIITDHIMKATEAAAGAVFLIDSRGQGLQARAVSGLFPPMFPMERAVPPDNRYLAHLLKNRTIGIGEGIIGFVAGTGESALIGDAQSDPRVPKTDVEALQIHSMMVTPLRLQQKILGVLAIINKRKGSTHQVFVERDLELMELLTDQAALTVYVVKLYEQLTERQLIEKELEVAQEFQRMLLPGEYPKAPGFDIAAFSRPALEIGGDYYDFIEIDPDHIGIAIVDVAGKGIPGALVMATLRSMLRAEAEGNLSPKQVLKRVNRRVLKDTKQNIFITIIYGIIDLRTHRMKFVRAGHEPLIIWNQREQKNQLFAPEGMALGMVEDKLFDVLEECEIDLEPGDMIVFYTDGVVEATSASGQEYGEDRFVRKLETDRAPNSKEQIDSILASINSFTGGIAQQDDITLVVVKVKAEEPAETGGLDRNKTSEKVI